METKESLSVFVDLPIGIKNVKLEIPVDDMIHARDLLQLLNTKGYKPRGAYWKTSDSVKLPTPKK